MTRVLVIGAGPAGGTAALWLAKAGVSVMLVDGEPRPGGTGWSGSKGDKLRQDLATAAMESRFGREVIDIDGSGRVTLAEQDGTLERLHPEIVIVAAGGVERLLPVSGWTLPGVFTLGALQLLNKRDGLVPEGPVVLAGSGPLLRLTAGELIAAGAHLSAVVDAGPAIGVGLLAGLSGRPVALAQGVGLELRRLVAGVPLIRGWPKVVGGRQAEAVEVNGRRFPAATVGLSFGLVPNTELARLAGASVDWDAASRNWTVRRNDNFESDRANLFFVGDGATVGGADLAVVEGVIAAAGVLERLGVAVPPALALALSTARRHLPRLRRAARVLAAWSSAVPPAAVDDDVVVCACEGTTVGEVRAALAAGYRQAGPLKLLTRAGMGRCQGRMCATIVQALASQAGFVLPPGSVRPPLRPIAAAAFGKDMPYRQQ
ncbi:NAD(P)/FAD-dependent oxidoreductase [Telmatospirillum sp.]|uniref:FAD/NAD(P)-dependent oxidoreductase n=1 Tax=Telmatospirillum sp. TaxID=2079197 RepID=UPI00283DD254|nr:NAD(P)/FAD-dependent oxidoreductase [Telmatospirillum sp.]MDR3440969.1 NAD(P)/FAD-dependent oxidoreductase [Telmatospirillum sp.]